MVGPAAKREAVGVAMSAWNLSQRRACGLVEVCRSSVRYQKQRRDESSLREQLRKFASERPRYGYRRLCVLLRRAGEKVNEKRVYRLYREEGLLLRKKARKKQVSAERPKPEVATGANQRWAMDFMSDALSSGRKFRTLNVVDVHTRECPWIEVDTSLPAARVVQVLERLAELRGLPEVITVDNGPEFAGKVLDEWAVRHGVKLHFIQPGRPVENAFIESFNARMRDECLNQHYFVSLEDARKTIEAWRLDYNLERPHSSLGNLSPGNYALLRCGHGH